MPSELAAELFALTHLEVSLDGKRVGTLAKGPRSESLLFEYDARWLSEGFSISPFSLPLRPGVFEASREAREGLHGVFRDSLPDDWGRLLQDRRLAQLGVRAGSLSPLARLSLVGASGLGALEYSPCLWSLEPSGTDDLDELSIACQELLDERGVVALDDLYAMGSSSGGARPKVMVDIEGEPWIVKFPTREDGADAGEREFAYARAAQECGIATPEVQLLPSAKCAGFFASKRFDRVLGPGGQRGKVHMASAAALLEASPFDAVDYRDLMRLSLSLTNDVSQSEQLFRVMSFNVLAENCDDHAKNFSFLCADGEWRLAPAYDLTYDLGFYGEHATLVNGRASNISDDDLVSVGVSGGISRRSCLRMLGEVRHVVSERLGGTAR